MTYYFSIVSNLTGKIYPIQVNGKLITKSDYLVAHETFKDLNTELRLDNQWDHSVIMENEVCFLKREARKG